MTYRFTEKERHDSEETAYILYMIIGSYFRKCTCRSRAMEKRLYLYYREMKENAQVSREERVIEEAEKALAPWADAFSEMNCIADIRKTENGYSLDFYTGFEGVHAETAQNRGVIIRRVWYDESN